jgi:hypothetical protein
MLKTHLLVVVGREREGVEDKGGGRFERRGLLQSLSGVDGGCVD